jgi:hypothetical protein
MPKYDPSTVVTEVLERMTKTANVHGNELEMLKMSRDEFGQFLSSTLVAAYEDGYYRGHEEGYDEAKW